MYYYASGGGMTVSGAGAVVANCTFTANATESGGGASVGGGATLINCTFAQNLAAYGSGVWAGTANLRNCIVWGNYNSPDQLAGTSATTVTHSDVQGGWTGSGFNNIDEDPLFVDIDEDPLFIDIDGRVGPGSPCIDAGINGAVQPDAGDLDGDEDTAEFTPLDLDGEPRFVDDPATADTGCGAPAVVDMGAYEFPYGVSLQPVHGDLDGDLGVGIGDLAALLDSWGPCGGCCAADLDGDGTVGIIDFLVLLANWRAPDCNDNAVPDAEDLANGTSQDCNANGFPDECEDCDSNGVADECDIALGTSTDFDGNGVPDECGVPPNNACGSAGPVGEGAFPFDTTLATTDGLSASCQGGKGFAFVNDIWFVYTPSFTGTATFSLCNAANYDSRLAVAFGTGQCPPLGGGTCSDNAPGCGLTSEVQMVVVAGFPYLVRVGGTTGGGPGVLSISCAPLAGP